MAYTSVNNGVGSTARRFGMSKANRNYTTQYFQNSHSSGDIRAYYIHQRYTGVGGGEVYRPVAEAYGSGCAAGATINAIHATGRVGSSGTVSGALNAIRATLEVGGTTPTPGGTLSALQLDSNIAAGATIGSTSAFVRVSDSGTADLLINLLSMPVPSAKHDSKLFVARHADCTASHGIRIVDGAGTPYWIMVSTDTPGN